MLVLSRHQGEKIRIGEDIEIVVVKIDRNNVRIGVRAPGEVPVFRTELLAAPAPRAGFVEPAALLG